MIINTKKKYYFNFYRAIIIAFFFNFIFADNAAKDLDRGLWIKSDQLLNEKSTKDIISNAYRSGYNIIFLQLDVHNDSRYNPYLDKQNTSYESSYNMTTYSFPFQYQNKVINIHRRKVRGQNATLFCTA